MLQNRYTSFEIDVQVGKRSIIFAIGMGPSDFIAIFGRTSKKEFRANWENLEEQLHFSLARAIVLKDGSYSEPTVITISYSPSTVKMRCKVEYVLKNRHGTIQGAQ